jgi:hypothetical protein
MTRFSRWTGIAFSLALALAWPHADAAEATPAFDTAKIEQLTGLKSTYSKEENVFKVSKPRTDVKVVADQFAATPCKVDAKDGMVKFTIGRTAMMHGVVAGNQMGVNTWAGFAGTDDAAVVDGDFAMTEDELQPVLKAMRAAGINIVAIHQHMTYEQPSYVFLHYWGKGKAVDLAKSVKKALDAQASAHHS